jgi:hypothetical protein
MSFQRIQVLVLRQKIGLAQQSRMPVRGPALIHDLASEHGIEIERFLAHGQENVTLPLLEIGRIFGDEPQQVPLRGRRQGGARALERLVDRGCCARQIVETALKSVGAAELRRLEVLRIALTAQRLKRIDMRFEREGRVEDLLDTILAVLLYGLADTPRMRRCLLDDPVAHLLLATFEKRIVLGEIGMAQNVRRNERVFLQ